MARGGRRIRDLRSLSALAGFLDGPGPGRVHWGSSWRRPRRPIRRSGPAALVAQVLVVAGLVAALLFALSLVRDPGFAAAAARIWGDFRHYYYESALVVDARGGPPTSLASSDSAAR
jgi:hypothetical protein